MAFTDSHIFRAFITDNISQNSTAKFNLTTDGFKCALYGNSGTPDRNATSALSAYNAATSQWVVANEISSAGQWAAGGVALSGTSVNSATANTVFFTASNTVSGSTATLTAVFGCLIYDTTTTTVANQGICYNYFGGSNSVTSGTFTVSYAASPSGIFNVTV